MSAQANDRRMTGKSPVKEKLWTKSFILGTITNFFVVMNYFMIMVVMSVYALDQYHASEALAGLCASIFVLGSVCARFMAGRIMERIGRRKLLIAGAAFEIVFSSLYLVGVPFAILFIIRFIHGTAYGACATAISTIVTSEIPKSRKGEGVGYFLLSFTLSTAIGPAIGIALSEISFEILFMVDAALGALILVGALVTRPPKIKKAAYITKAADLASRAKAVIGAHEDVNTSEQKTARQRIYDRHPRLSRYLELPIIPIALVAAASYFGYSSIVTFLTPFAEDMHMADAASGFFVFFALTIFATRPYAGRLFDRRGPRGLMTAAFIAYMVGMVFMGIAHNVWSILSSALLLGFGVGTVQSTSLAMAVAVTPDQRLSLANSTFYISVDMAGGIGPLVLGAIIPFTGYHNLFLLMTLCGTVGLILFHIVVRIRAK